MRTTWEFFSTEQIVFGSGSINRLDEVLKRLGAHRILMVTDPGITKCGIAERVLSLLETAGYEVAVYDQVVPEPPVESAVHCYEFAKAQEVPDTIIGLGGGSSIDMAKIVALLIAHGGHPLDYYGGENHIPGPIAPLVAIPTTAGTGSEVTSVAVLTDTVNNLKVGISDNYLRPAVALLDPELTLGLPPYVTACSGIDALAHAIEAYTAKPYSYIESKGRILFQGANPISDALAIQAVKLIADNLTVAVQQGSNLEARSNMMLSSLLAGMAFSNAGTALAHALAYPIGGLTKSPHGEVTGLLLPHVMQFNASVQTEKLIKISEMFGLPAHTKGLSRQDIAFAACDAVMNVLQAIGLPSRLSQIGIGAEHFPEIIEQTLNIDRLIRNNPRAATTGNLLEFLQKAL